MQAVQEIWRYPMKSLAGERLDDTEVGPRGLWGDRAWAVRDEVRGGIRGAKQIADLMKLSARYPSPPSAEGSTAVEITFEDGSRASTVDSDINQRLSAALHHEVTLWPLVPAENLAHYRRGAPDYEDMETEFRRVFAREADEPLPDLSVFSPEVMEYESPPGTYFDAFSILVVTAKSLASLQDRAPDSRIDVRRFRPNFLISGVNSDDPFPELSWEGRRARLGSVTLQLTIGCPRCVMTTRGFADLPKDPGVMRALVKETGGTFGIYADVEEPGHVRAGDAFELLD